jgi:hypothetical protein
LKPELKWVWKTSKILTRNYNLLYKCPEEHRFQAAGNERKKERILIERMKERKKERKKRERKKNPGKGLG